MSSVDTAPPQPYAVPARYRRWELVVFVVAVAARLVVFLRHGGVHGTFGYDSGVYFAASDALIHGRMPYADFVQLHPPVVDLVLTPFTALTHLMSDAAAFAVANVAFVLLGGINAVLTGRVGLRLGLGRAGALAAAALYAVWYGSIGSEFLIKLEPLGNLFMLLGLLLALRANRDARAVTSLVAGVPLGLAISTKIWWVVPVVLLVAWHGWRLRSGRPAASLAAGTVAAAVVVNLPFFIAAPDRMWHMVVLAQLGRNRRHGFVYRLGDISTVSQVTHLSRREHIAVAVALLVVLAVVAAFAWRVRAARFAVVVLIVQGVLLLVSPSWYPYYTDYLAIALAIMLGGATASVRAGARREQPVSRRAIGPVAAVATAAVTLAILLSNSVVLGGFSGGTKLAADVRHTRCIMANTPVALIHIDALSRGLADGCPNWIDVTGPTYVHQQTYKRPLLKNRRWQAALLAYLRRGQAVIVLYGPSTGVTPELQRQITSGGVLAHAGTNTVYRTP